MIETFNTVMLYAHIAPFGAHHLQSTRFHFLKRSERERPGDPSTKRHALYFETGKGIVLDNKHPLHPKV